MSQPADCPDDNQLREYAAGRLRAESFSTVAAHLRSCTRCRLQVFAGEPTIEDDGPHSFRFDLTGDTLNDAETINPRTDFDARLNQDDADSAVRYLFPDRQGSSLGWLGNYEVEYELGRGGMGIVFKGFDPLLHRVVAIKVMAPPLAVNERARLRFSREARAVAAINHPNVVTIHAVSEHKDVPYLVMEYVAGESLEDRIRHRRPLPTLEIVRIGAQIADGLAAAHAVGTIHRDVKPANVMLENSVDRVKISDFGLAQVALDCAELTPTNQVLGTPSYMSPELVEGKEIDARSDLFSLGCVIYAMVVGHSPFIGSHMLDVVRRVSDFDPLPLDEVDPSIPKSLAALVSRLLEKEPKNRIQSANEVADELRRLLTTESLEPSRDVAPLLSQPKGLFSQPERRGLLKRGAVVGLLGVVAVAAIALAWWRPSVSSWFRPQPVVRSGNQPLTVSHDGGADFTDLRKAVEQAKPGSTIQILDDGRYEGPIIITPLQRLSGLTIESPRGATLFAAEKEITLLEIRDTPGITVRGMRIECGREQHGVVLYKNVSGMVLDKLQIDQPAGSRKAAVFLTNGTRGSAESPARLSELDVTSGGLGIVLGGETLGAAISSVRIERCRIRGAGLLIILENDIHDVTVSECILSDGQIGVTLDVTGADPAANIMIRNNTFFGLNSWISLGKSRDDSTNLSIARNLIIDCDGTNPSRHDLSVVGPRWFEGNVWRGGRGVAGAGFVARVVDDVPLLSLDPASPDYLRPADPATISVKDAATGGSAFAGAVLPRHEAPTSHP
ncbi:MAG: protein kinase [Paludisphaera borealis]|uniref:protein kinase domain-containing protein n=1 Tax=Paludisphaera borealis TaxID=1387353 RepID=UPI00283E9971|nr:protein kinase [Paludisphaera borealis]MDR3620431.1 protein kinase [Paludisphaera borealis]